MLVIGKIGCKGCEELKQKLTEENTEFDYKIFEKLPRDEKRKYAQIYRESNTHFPMVFKNGILCTEKD